MGTPKFGQTTKCICLTTTFLARDICEDPGIPLKIKAMLHDLYLWFSLLLIRLRKGVWKLRWWAALRYLPKLFISVKILGITHQKLTRIGLPRLRWYVTVSEGPVSVPFSDTLELQFADDLKSLHRSWIYYLYKNKLVKHLAKH